MSKQVRFVTGAGRGMGADFTQKPTLANQTGTAPMILAPTGGLSSRSITSRMWRLTLLPAAIYPIFH